MLRSSLVPFVSIVVSLSGMPTLLAGEPIDGIGPAGPVVQLHTDFAFTEGPAADRHGNLYFTDIPNLKILKLDAQDVLSVFTDASRHANGLMWNAAGELIACEMDGQIVAWTAGKEPTRRVIAAEYKGQRFNAPNDLVLDRSGGIYFTDPHFQAPKPLPQGAMGVYYVARSGQVSRLIDDLAAPNGIMLSPDQKTLYVFPSSQPEMRAYAVVGPGKLGAGRDFCVLKTSGGGFQGADGATIDTEGNLYVTSGLGVQVVSPHGKVLGILEFPESPANVTFGGKAMKTLYVTARTSLYAMPMDATGHRFDTE